MSSQYHLCISKRVESSVYKLNHIVRQEIHFATCDPMRQVLVRSFGLFAEHLPTARAWPSRYRLILEMMNTFVLSQVTDIVGETC